MLRNGWLVWGVLAACEKPVEPELRIAGPLPGDMPLTVQPRQFEATRAKELTTASADQPIAFHASYRAMHGHSWGVRVVDAAGTVCRDTTETIRDENSRKNPNGYGGFTQPLLYAPGTSSTPCVNADHHGVPGRYTATFMRDGTTIATRTFEITP